LAVTWLTRDMSRPAFARSGIKARKSEACRTVERWIGGTVYP